MTKPETYAELHSHTYYSFLDGACSPGEMVNEAHKLGLSAIAITDHNGLYGTVEFSRAAREVAIKTVYGAELSLSSPRRTGELDPHGDHLVILARSPQGYSSLSRAISTANLAGVGKDKTVYSLEGLASQAQGDWAVLTGCRKGLVPSRLINQGPSAGLTQLERLVDLFGRQNVFVEIWHHASPLDTYRNDALVELAVTCNVDIVATSNAHYATHNHYQLAQVLAAIRANTTLDNLDPWTSSAPTSHLKSPSEQSRIFARWPGVVARAAELGDECAFDLNLIAPKLPRFSTPDGSNEDTFLKGLTEDGATQRYGPRHREIVPGAWKQIDHELEVISQLGFSGYFLVVWEIVEFCKANNIYCQGRGSAANSAVCFALGITRADAVSLGLLFERFLSVARDGPPDIDLDIESGRREEVIQHVYTLYGRDRAALVANVVSYRSKSAIRDVGKVFGYSLAQIATWTLGVETLEPPRDQPGGPLIARQDQPAKGHQDPPEIVLRLAHQLIGIPRHLSIHPGGMVICDRPVSEVCPIEYARMKDRTVLQWDKESVAAISLVKFDLLGLGMLEALHRSVDLVSHFYGVDLDLAAIGQEDRVYNLLCRGDTIGVFQVESGAQMNTLPRMKPRCFYDLVVEVALIRPGPIQGQAVHPYLRRRDGLEEITYLHPILERSLGKTLGVPLFQEQLMAIAIDAGGFSPTQADELRAAMGSKRSGERMDSLKEALFAGLERNAIVGSAAESIWDGLAAFSNFGFPESHAISFAYLVYASAWLKVYYPEAFYCALLNSQPMGFWSPQSLVGDAKRHGVVVKPPRVNSSWSLARLDRSETGQVLIRLGLSSIRTISQELGELLARHAPYSSLHDIVTKVRLDRAQLDALAQSGALEDIDASRRKVLWNTQAASTYRQGQLPGLLSLDEAPDLGDMTTLEQIEADIWNLGLTTGPGAMDLARPYLKSIGAISSRELIGQPDNKKVVVAGVVTHRQRPESAKGATFITLEDEHGIIRATCSVGTWKRFRSVARTSPGLVIVGRIERSSPLEAHSGITKDSPVAINVRVEKITPLSLGLLPDAKNFR